MIGNFFGNLPTPIKGVIIFLGGGSLVASYFLFGASREVLWIVFIGIGLVGLLIVIFCLIWSALKKLKGKIST